MDLESLQIESELVKTGESKSNVIRSAIRYLTDYPKIKA